MIDTRLQKITAEQPYPLLFMSISGAHLYGFPSPDSDYDLRGVYILPAREVLGLYEERQTIEVTKLYDGLEIDLVTYDIKKFFHFLLKKNGLVLEQIYSPLIVNTSAGHEELKVIGKRFISRHHYHHYYGFAEAQWKLFHKNRPYRVKPLLYVYRVLLSGIYLMHTGEVEANLLRLNETFNLFYIPDLVACKLGGPEQATLEDADLPFYQSEYERLLNELEQSSQESSLPDGPSTADKNILNDLLVRIRLETNI